MLSALAQLRYNSVSASDKGTLFPKQIRFWHGSAPDLPERNS